MSDTLGMQHLSIFFMKHHVAKPLRYIPKGLIVVPFISDHSILLAGK